MGRRKRQDAMAKMVLLGEKKKQRVTAASGRKGGNLKKVVCGFRSHSQMDTAQ